MVEMCRHFKYTLFLTILSYYLEKPQPCYVEPECHSIVESIELKLSKNFRKQIYYFQSRIVHIQITSLFNSTVASDDQRTKLNKLLNLWESKSNFFDACVMSKLRSAMSSMQEYKTSLLSTHAAVVNAIQQTTKQTFDSYQQQHQAFIQHANQQIGILETQKQTLEQQSKSQSPITNKIPPLIPSHQMPNLNESSNQMVSNNGGSGVLFPSSQHSQSQSRNSSQQQQQQQNQGQQSSNNIPSLLSSNLYDNSPMSQTSNSYQSQIQQSQQRDSLDNYNYNSNSYNQSDSPASDSNGAMNSGDGGNEKVASDFSYPPPLFQIPDLSKPPPGFVSEEDLTPTVPYFELPAGLMVPLIRLEDYTYKPLDPNAIKLPPPTLPSERLVAAVEAFYSLPSHERPRDGEGWEKLSLYEYYKVKNAAKKQKQEDIETGIREKSRSPSPIILEVVRPKSNKRRYRSKSRSKSRSRSRSKSPIMESRRSMNRSSGRNRQKSRSPINRRSPSPMQNSRRNLSPPYRRGDRSSNKGGSSGGNNSNQDRNIDRDRSISPPSFLGGGNYSRDPKEHIEESNKGHQMLMKMGWGGTGTGLGSQGQGIDSPISGGEVRDRSDLYKVYNFHSLMQHISNAIIYSFQGMGINFNDPYESFRKNKGAAFITRMKARADERS